MARYYFHIRDGSRIVSDDEGMELLGMDAAWAEAHASADDLTREAIRNGTSAGPCAIEIWDDAGSLLGAVRVSEQKKLA
jgi:hypothetical protein